MNKASCSPAAVNSQYVIKESMGRSDCRQLGACRREKGMGDIRSHPGVVQPDAHLRQSPVQGTSEMLPLVRMTC